MQTLFHSTTSRYTLAPTRNVGDFSAKLAKCTGRSRKSAIRDLRTKGNFPKFEAGMSTADYVKMFEAWGTPCKPVEWEQLNEEPCTLYSGADTCETLPAGFETWEDFDAAQSAETAPESTQAAANDEAAPNVPDPDPAAPGAIVAAEVDQVSAVNIDRAMIERFGVSDPAACAHIPGAAAEIARIEAAEIVAVFYRDFANCNDGAAPGVDAILQRAQHLRGTAAGFADLPNPDRGAPYAEAARILESDAQSKPAAQSEPERIADVMRARVANTAEALREAAEELEDRATRVPATRAAEYCAAAAMLRSDAEAAPAVVPGYASRSARVLQMAMARSAARHFEDPNFAPIVAIEPAAGPGPDPAPDSGAAPIETAPAEVAPPHYAICHPLTTQSDARAPVDGERFRILERSRATYDNLWTCAEVSTARRAADVAQSIIAGWTGGERWAVCADSGAFLYGIGADGKPMSAAPVCAPVDPLPTQPDTVPVPGKLAPVRPDYVNQWDAWLDVRNGRADPDAYQGHVIECMEAALATGLFYNSQTWPAAAELMFERHHYPDWRDSSADNGVARFFGTDCYNAHDIIRKRAAAAADKAAADGFHAGQKFARLMFNDYKLCTGAVLVSFTHTGKECRLTGKRAGRPFEFTCTATTLQNAIERAAERAERLKAKRERAKPAPVKAAPPPAELAPLAGDSDADPAEAKREAERAAALADAMARFTRGARVTAEPAQYFDGRPVAGWPNAQFLGTVRECFDNHGLASVRVKWDSGRIDLQSADRLTVIEPRTVSAERYATDTHERPCAAPGLKSYRARGAFGWIMIGATDDADAMREARRSAPDPHSLQVWNGAEYVPADDPLPGESKPDPVPPDTQSETGRDSLRRMGANDYARGDAMRGARSAPEQWSNADWLAYEEGYLSEQAKGNPVPGDTIPAANPVETSRPAPCKHPPARLYAGHAKNADGVTRPWVACCDCGDVLTGGAEPDDIDDDETIPAPLDGLDVAELDGLAEFERAGGEVKPIAPAYRDDAPRATPTPSLRIPAGDPRARIPARFARVYLLQA